MDVIKKLQRLADIQEKLHKLKREIYPDLDLEKALEQEEKTLLADSTLMEQARGIYGTEPKLKP